MIIEYYFYARLFSSLKTSSGSSGAKKQKQEGEIVVHTTLQFGSQEATTAERYHSKTEKKHGYKATNNSLIHTNICSSTWCTPLTLLLYFSSLKQSNSIIFIYWQCCQDQVTAKSVRLLSHLMQPFSGLSFRIQSIHQ